MFFVLIDWEFFRNYEHAMYRTDSYYTSPFGYNLLVTNIVFFGPDEIPNRKKNILIRIFVFYTSLLIDLTKQLLSINGVNFGFINLENNNIFPYCLAGYIGYLKLLFNTK